MAKKKGKPGTGTTTGGSSTSSPKPSLSGLGACQSDSSQAVLDSTPGPPDPRDYQKLLSRLEASKEKLPPLYRQAVFNPYFATLQEIGPDDFKTIIENDQYENFEMLMMDIAHAILQNGEGYEEKPTDAFQEVVSDLYDGFLSAEDRVGVKPPDKGVIPPLVKWGNPNFGPYTYPVTATASFKVEAAIVNLPPANAKGGLLAWSALGHETGGHDILRADSGLSDELSRNVLSALKKAKMGSLASYWASRIGETASDVLGILNMGPAAGIGLIGYFRGIRGALNDTFKLQNTGPSTDTHPADILRGYLAASTVRLLSFDGASGWADAILSETEKDVGDIRIAGRRVKPADAAKSARIVAEVLVQTPVASLENHALGEIQDWRNEDEGIVRDLSTRLKSGETGLLADGPGIYAAHAVAAAVTLAVGGDMTPQAVFPGMIDLLKTMHDGNLSWGPLFLAHPGDLLRHVVYEKAGRKKKA